MQQTESVTFTLEEKIIHRLILQTTSIEDNGLFYGKVGISIAFFECSRFWNNLIYSDFANELNDSFFDQINDQINHNFEKGLCGLGWGIEYMAQRFAFNRNNYEVCVDIDKKIMAIDIRRVNDLSLNAGLEGILHYVLIRLKGFGERQKNKPFDDTYLKNVYDRLQLLPKTGISSRLNDLKQIFVSYIDTGALLYEPDICSFISHQEILNDEDLLAAQLGLTNGLAGKLVEIILSLGK